jgi:large subunit ribosomal protein L19
MTTLAQGVITPVKIQERTQLGIRPGDTVRVHQKVIEKGKTRIQMFEGLVIAVKHGNEAGGTFTVRAQMSGVGVEKIFPLYSPVIDKIEITKRSKVRRAKLYFIREKVAREVRRQLRNNKTLEHLDTSLSFFNNFLVYTNSVTWANAELCAFLYFNRSYYALR